MIKLKLCDNKSYIIQMLPDFKRGGGRTIFKSSFGNIYSSLFPASETHRIYIWGHYRNMDNNLVEAYGGYLKRDLKLYELWAESINERFVICLN